jgi:MFS family permease
VEFNTVCLTETILNTVSQVTWDGPDDPSNPYNWSTRWKWTVTLLTSLGGLVTLMSGSTMAPALSAIGEDLSIGDAETQLTLSIFVLAFAFGPLILAPLTEVFERRSVWILASLWYLLWNTVCGFAHTKALMVSARYLAGLGASGEFAVSTLET